MTMYYISEFCRICLQNDNNLIDIMKIENEPSETLLTKLKLCVSEVEWTTLKVLMCNSCIRRLNSSYDFKKQCLRSAITLKNYLELLNEAQSKPELIFKGQADQDKSESYVPLVPNQKLIKLFIPPSQNSSFQNVFLNVIPPGKIVQNGIAVSNNNTNGADQNIYLNINSTLQKATSPECNNENATQDVCNILLDSPTEELSIEIDPMDYGCLSEGSSPIEGDDHEAQIKDWEDLITSTKILPVPDLNVPSLVPLSKNNKEEDDKLKCLNQFVPILPKPNQQEITIEEKYEFFNSGHFLTSKEYREINSATTCETCGKTFDTKKLLRQHIKQNHGGKFPYHCETCGKEFSSKVSYKSHLQKHIKRAESKNRESLTLQDFLENNAEAINMSTAVSLENPADDIIDGKEHKCEACPRIFTSANGLLRHRVRKHKQKTKKKYFIKGQKNARCDICNRDFSTQSYMQMHKKLHLRHGLDYKGKSFKRKKGEKRVKAVQPIVAQEPMEVVVDTEVVEAAEEVVQENDVNVEIVEEEIIKESHVESVSENGKPSSDDENKAVANEENQEQQESNGNERNEKNDKESSPGGENSIQELQLFNLINMAPFYDLNTDQDEVSILQEFQNLDILKVDNSTQCMYCNKVFSRKHDLKRHLNNIHLKSIQFKCHLCNNTFYEAFHLTRHLRAHYTCASCTICQKMFSTENDMMQHNEMIHDNMAFWQCGVCYVMFNEPYVLKQHMIEHQGPIIYRCHLCDDEFAESRDLSRHIIEHSGMYSCRTCEKNFANEHEKSVHDANTHGPTKKYECDLCSKSYKKIHELTRHRNLHLLLLSQEKRMSTVENSKEK